MKITITDDDAIVSASLKTIIEADGEVEVLGIGQNGNDAVELYKKHRPDIALLDIQMPDKNGLEAGKEILEINPNAKVLFLTTFSDNEYIIQALSIGAKGYILKQEFASITPALKAVNTGQIVFGNDIVSKLSHLVAEDKAFNYRDYGITEKEEEIILLVAEGYNNKEISEELYLSAGTVRNYLSTILEKLKLRDRTQLVVFHYQNQKILVNN